MVPGGFSFRSDKVLSEADSAAFLANELYLEEKMDGENLGISFDGTSLLYQSRGGYVTLGGKHFQGLESWARPRSQRLADVMGTDLVLFGEWCSTRHSVSYNALPDWFLLFDVFDRTDDQFWDVPLRDELADQLGVSVVPLIGVGSFSRQSLLDLIGRSRFGEERMEGLVARVRGSERSAPRAKVVRSDFVQGIGMHWSSGARVRNRLAA